MAEDIEQKSTKVTKEELQARVGEADSFSGARTILRCPCSIGRIVFRREYFVSTLSVKGYLISLLFHFLVWDSCQFEIRLFRTV